MLGRWWLWLCAGLRVKYAVYKKTIWWLVFWVALGAVLAIISIAIGGVGTDDVNYHLIDRNLLYMADVDAGIGGFIWQRMVAVLLPPLVLLVFGLLSRFTALIIFPLVLMHGYWLCLSIWWTFMYYSFNAIFLLAFYLLWLLLVTAVLLAALIWVYDLARTLRERHYSCRGLWGGMVRGAMILVAVAVVMGLIEYLVFWAILGRIVYKPL